MVPRVEKHPPTDDPHGGLEPPTFGLRSLFWLVAFSAVVLASARALDPKISAVVALLGLGIFAHVAGNVLGTRLRQRGPASMPVASRGRVGAADGSVTDHFAPSTRLSHRERVSRTLLVLSILGALGGAIVGGGLLAVLNWEKATVANVTLAVLSCAVLGGLLGFWLSSFLKVLGQAWWQAHEAASQDQARQRRY